MAAEDAWIRVRDGDNSVLFEGILGAGQRFALPARADSPSLKAGNAGGIFVFVDGVRYGPVGRRGQVARDVSLIAEAVRETMPAVDASPVDSAQNGPAGPDRVEASLRPRR
jgi:hypothetical protein